MLSKKFLNKIANLGAIQFFFSISSQICKLYLYFSIFFAAKSKFILVSLRQLAKF